jgi:hypothetical protein
MQEVRKGVSGHIYLDEANSTHGLTWAAAWSFQKNVVLLWCEQVGLSLRDCAQSDVAQVKTTVVG